MQKGDCGPENEATNHLEDCPGAGEEGRVATVSTCDLN
jgi:hypothetical protein